MPKKAAVIAVIVIVVILLVIGISVGIYFAVRARNNATGATGVQPANSAVIPSGQNTTISSNYPGYPESYTFTASIPSGVITSVTSVAANTVVPAGSIFSTPTNVYLFYYTATDQPSNIKLYYPTTVNDLPNGFIDPGSGMTRSAVTVNY